MVYGYADLHKENAYTSGAKHRVASNSLVVAQWDLLAESGGLAVLATTNNKILWVSKTKKTFDSDNATVGLETVMMTDPDLGHEFEMPTDGNIAQTDVGKYYNITTSQLIDQSTGTTTKTDSLNFQLVKYKSARLGIFKIVNDIKWT